MQGMGQEMDGDVEAKLQVLQEIKDLMDTRLGDSMNPSKPMDEESPAHESGESPEMESQEDSGAPVDEEGVPEVGGATGEVGMDDKEKLMQMLRSKLG